MLKSKHKDYDPSTGLNDIAVITLADEVELNQYIQIACLTSLDTSIYPRSNLDAYGVGWSFKSENRFNDSILNSKKMKLVEKNECRTLTKDLTSDPDAFLCTGKRQFLRI